MHKKLPPTFYTRTDVVKVARELLGKVLCTYIDGIYTTGIITETEAYNGAIDKASHAYNNRRTARTEVMFAKGGTAYVYLCYGMHHLFNVVTNKKDIPHAVLIRSIEPLDGLIYMLQRRGFTAPKYNLTAGPGAMSKALGIIYNKHTGLSLNDSTIWIEDRRIKVKPSDIIATPRIGVQYAGEDAQLPYRFIIKDNPWCSKLILKAPKNPRSGSSSAP